MLVSSIKQTVASMNYIFILEGSWKAMKTSVSWISLQQPIQMTATAVLAAPRQQSSPKIQHTALCYSTLAPLISIRPELRQSIYCLIRTLSQNIDPHPRKIFESTWKQNRNQTTLPFQRQNIAKSQGNH